jgi:Raf kinase inhibitor-like YbhB/YbcL family protein
MVAVKLWRLLLAYRVKNGSEIEFQTVMSPFEIESDAFENQAAIPVRFSFQGDSISPELRWQGVPEGTRELALICEDHDVPTPKAIVHWLVYGIDPSVSELPEDLPKKKSLSSPLNVRQGLNSFFFSGYLGPNPGFWDSAHHYRFRLFALREPLNLAPRAGRTEFYKAIDGKVINVAEVVGTYAKTIPQRIKAVVFWLVLFGVITFFATRVLGIGTP